MKASKNCLDVIKHYESLRLRAYPDPATGGEPWTIGHGHTGLEVVPGLIWTQQQADDALVADVAKFESMVNKFCWTRNQGRFDALVSFAFNVGGGRKGVKDGLIELKGGQQSSLLRLTNAGQYQAAADQFALWCNAAGKPMLGLIRRRASERALYEGYSAAVAIATGQAIRK
jgi:lysozyme